MRSITKIALSNNKKNKARSILIMLAIVLTTMLLTIISTVGNGMISLQKENAASSYGSNYGLFVGINHTQLQEVNRRAEILTIISTVGNGMISLQKENAASSYGSNYGLFVGINHTQLQEVNRRAEIDEIGIMRTGGILKGNEKGGFVSIDEPARKMLPYNQEYLLEEGAYPEGVEEIAASKAFFESQGYKNVSVGDRVSLYYRSGMSEEYSEQDFVISGILYDRAEYQIESSYVVFCSSSFYESQFLENERKFNVYFTLKDTVNVSMNNIDPVLTNIATSCGIDSKSLIINNYYLSWTLEPSYEMIAVCGILILGIVLFSVVVIFNIFQVGIAQKIQEYGKIKALGATKRQLKRLIFEEGMILAMISIPIGLIIGFLIAKGSFGWLIEQGNLVADGMKNNQVPLFSVTVILISAGASLLTVILALRKPMKIVAKISPIEATRYLENSTRKNQGMRRGKKNISVFSMAMANIVGNKKRTIETILTMGLSCVLFVIISNYVGNIDTEYEARIFSMAMANIVGNKKRTIETILTMGLSCVLFVIISNYVGNIDTEYEARRGLNHGQFELKLDYFLEWDEVYVENNLDSILKNNPLNESLIAKIRTIPGVQDVMTREIVVANINGTKQVVSIVNKEDFEKMRYEGDLGSMDYDEAVENGNLFFGWAMWMESDGYSLGDSISLELDNGTEKFNYEGNIAGAFVSADTYLVLPEEVYHSLQHEGSSYGYLWVDCDENDVISVEQKIKSLIEDTSYIQVRTYHDELEMAEFTSRMMNLACYLFMAIVGLIGFMNLANTMIINIITKKQEYGVLQAVGMTNRQLNWSLQIQGLIFTLGTIGVALIVGLPLGHMIFSYAKKNGIFGMNVYHVPVVPILVMITLVGILQIVLSFMLSHNLKKETLVERIRYQG